MIIGFSHLTWNSAFVERDISKFKELGYESVFDEKELENNYSKKNLLGSFSVKHDIKLLKRSDSYDIEIINHHSKNMDVQNRLFYNDSMMTILIPSGCFAKEIDFWCWLGFKESGNCLRLSRPVKTWNLDISFVSTEQDLVEQKLDLQGFTSIAFIVKDLALFKSKLKNKVIWISEIFTLEVNEQKMDILLFKTPSGVIIELIEVLK